MDNGCWFFTGTRNNKGYGRIKINGVATSAHRVSFELHKGPITNNLWVLHTCDNPSCINPDHLFLGTAKDNNDDMIAKGRDNTHSIRPIGPRALCEDDVIAIRKLLKDGYSQRDIAEQYSVNQPTISFINTGRTWGWLK